MTRRPRCPRWEITTALTPAARRAGRVNRRSLRQLVRHTLTSEDAPSIAVSVTLVDDREIRALNARHLGHDRVTDVISFEMPPPGPGDAPAAGDVYVSLDRAIAQAAARRRRVEDELRLLVVHGVLHSLGHDDVAAPARRRMRARERAALRTARCCPPLLA
jgi:probable rRNA maturation factor